MKLRPRAKWRRLLVPTPSPLPASTPETDEHSRAHRSPNNPPRIPAPWITFRSRCSKSLLAYDHRNHRATAARPHLRASCASNCSYLAAVFLHAMAWGTGSDSAAIIGRGTAREARLCAHLGLARGRPSGYGVQRGQLCGPVASLAARHARRRWREARLQSGSTRAAPGPCEAARPRERTVERASAGGWPAKRALGAGEHSHRAGASWWSRR